MKTQDSDTTNVETMAAQTTRPRGRRWLVVIGAAAVVVLLVSLGRVALGQLGQHGDSSQGAPTPPSGKWVQVLNGYAIISLAAARSDPAIIYACAIKTQQAGLFRYTLGSYILVRSADFGEHWRDIAGKAGLGDDCEFTIDPTDSNDIYAVGAPGGLKASRVLMHSTDGGQSWNTITPVFQIPGLGSPLVWSLLELRMEGNQLFAVQVVPVSAFSLPGQTTPSGPGHVALARLVTSVDGGYNWTVLDSHFAGTQQVLSYAVDPTNTDTIYEVVGLPLSPVVRLTPPQPVPGHSTPYPATSSDLYKTTDSGANWHLLQQGLPRGAQVQLAIDKPDLVYVGGTVGGPGPLVQQRQGTASSNRVNATTGVTTGFTLSVSSDGGANWHNVTLPPAVAHVQRWYVAADGRVYADTGVYVGKPFMNTGKGTGVPKRSGPGKPFGTPIPRVTPTIPGNPVISLPENTPTPTPTEIPIAPTVEVPGTPPTTAAGPPPTVQVYAAAADSWSQVTALPSNTMLLTVTSAGTNGGAVLWFMGSGSNGNDALFRYVV